MEVFTIMFTPGGAFPSDALTVTFSAEWGPRRTTGVFHLGLTHAQLTALLGLLQVYADKGHRDAIAQGTGAREALAALDQLAAPRNISAPLDDVPRQLGEALFAALFPPDSSAHTLWTEFYSAAGQHAAEEYRLVLRFIDRRDSAHMIRLLLALPWELLHVPQIEVAAQRDMAVPLLLEQGRTLTLVRSYQPPDRLALHYGELAPVARPSILLLETHADALASLAARVRPPELDQSQRMLWCRIELGAWPLDPAQLRGINPQIVHMVGHGLRQESRNWLALGPAANGDDEELAGPYRLAHALEQAQISATLIASFVCLSAVSPAWPPEVLVADTAALDDRPHTPSARGYALLDALCRLAPALLLMQGLLDAEDAAAGSDAFYHALARGEGVVRAARALRQAIYSRAEQIGRDLDAGWWLPTLYLADSNAELPLVAPWPPPGDEARQALLLLPELVALLDRPISPPRLVVLECRPQGGKSVRLRRLADHLRADQRRRLIELPNCGEQYGTWLDTVRRDLATMLRALRFSPRRFSIPVYDEIVCTPGTSPTLFVLCDDGDKLPPEIWRALLPAGINAPLVFVTTANQWTHPAGLPIEPELISLPPLRDDELRALQRPRLNHFESQRPSGLADDDLFRRLSAYLTFARIPLSVDTLAGLAGSDRASVARFLKHATDHQVAFQRSTDGRYELSVQLVEWSDPAYRDFVAAVERYARSLDDQNNPRPDELYDIMIHPDHYQHIDPLPSSVRDGPRLDRWVHLAGVLIDHRGQPDACARIALFQARKTPFTIVRDGLYYLILQRTRLIPPDLYDGWVWRILWPEYAAQFDEVPGGRAPPGDARLLDSGDPAQASLQSSDDLEKILDQLVEQPYLMQHPALLADLRRRAGDDPVLRYAYDLHRRAIAEQIQQEYEDNNLLEKRDRTMKELQAESNRPNSPMELWEVAHDADQRIEWLRKLQHRLLNFVLVLDAER